MNEIGMTRYINLDKFIKDFNLLIDRSFLGETTCTSQISIGEISSLIVDQPIANVQPVVHCGDCKFYNIGDENLGDCIRFKNFIHRVRKDDYCSHGVKMDGENNV